MCHLLVTCNYDEYLLGESLSILWMELYIFADATGRFMIHCYVFFVSFILGGFFHGINNLTYGVDLKLIRWMGVLQVRIPC